MRRWSSERVRAGFGMDHPDKLTCWWNQLFKQHICPQLCVFMHAKRARLQWNISLVFCDSVCVFKSKLLCWMTQSSDLDLCLLVCLSVHLSICLSVLRSVCCLWGTDLWRKECVPSFLTQLWERLAVSVFYVEQEFLEAAEEHFIIFSALLVGDEGSSCSRLCSPFVSISTDTLAQSAPQTG